MRTDVLSLITRTETTDSYGDPVIIETARDVFCELLSVGQTEFYQANAQGLKPEVKFRLSDYLEYQREKIVKYEGVYYHVLRTFRKGLELELTCYLEVNPG